MIQPLIRNVLARIREQGDEAQRHPERAQARVHRRISQTLVGTQAARLQALPVYESLETYRRRVRLTRYEDYAPLIQQAIARPRDGGLFERGQTWSFGHTSSGSKFIPFTRAHLASFRRFQLDAAAEIGFGLGESAVFSGSSFMIQGNLETRLAPSGARLGYSSAVMVEETPWLLKRGLKPPLEDLRERELDERVRRIGESLIDTRPRILAGIPEYVAAILARLLRGPREAAVREALSQVTVYGWSGSLLGSRREFLAPLFAPGCQFVDAVSATEGALGIRCADTGAYRFALNRSLLLFTPTDSPNERFFAWELEPGQSYEVVLGNHAGLLGYRLGDRIRRARLPGLRFELLPRAQALGLAEPEARVMLGTTSDFYLFMNSNTRQIELLLEGDTQPLAPALDRLRGSLGGLRVDVRLLARGRIADATLKASAGFTKMPRVHQDASLHAALTRHLA